MDESGDTTAGDLVNRLGAAELGRIFTRYGEERWAKRIAQQIVELRGQSPIRSSKQLADIVSAAVPRQPPSARKIHPATRVFMALRIAVNKELERLEQFLDTAVDFLNPGGRLCVLSFHSLEDRIVKRRLRALAKGCDCPPGLPVCVCHKTPVLRAVDPQGTAADSARGGPQSRSTKHSSAGG